MSQFEATTQLLMAENAFKIRLSCGRVVLSYGDVIELWRTDETFCTLFNDTLASVRFEAFFWETPPVNVKSRSQPFECVLLDAPSLAAASPDPFSFRALFSAAKGEQVVVFDNLGGDARLIAP